MYNDKLCAMYIFFKEISKRDNMYINTCVRIYIFLKEILKGTCINRCYNYDN